MEVGPDVSDVNSDAVVWTFTDFPSKDDLLRDVVDQLLTTIPPIPAGVGWVEGSRQYAPNLRKIALENPEWIRLLSPLRPTPYGLARAESTLQVLQGRGGRESSLSLCTSRCTDLRSGMRTWTRPGVGLGAGPILVVEILGRAGGAVSGTSGTRRLPRQCFGDDGIRACVGKTFDGTPD
ncbi:hypothetical protein BDB13_3530 [Rhodococcus sp. OK302]|nr:hypothetical protein BDB13_3530 [Rhodococcus sp. OK302]